MRGYSNHLESLYNDIFEQVNPRLKTNNGVLFTAIHVILEADNSQASEICRYLDIREDTSLENDFKFADRVIAKPFEFKITFFRDQELEKDKDMKNWIVVIACVLVGAYACIKFIEDTKKRKVRQSPRDDMRPPTLEKEKPISPPQPVTVALCLVVPAYLVSNIKDQYPIDVYEIEKLIDKASYFICTHLNEADSLQQYLEFTNENILNIGEQREVYIRINIPNGQEMIGKTSTYILKRNLPSNSQGVVRQIACLNNLSGLEKFNRV
jgi:hypothetical protein